MPEPISKQPTFRNPKNFLLQNKTSLVVFIAFALAASSNIGAAILLKGRYDGELRDAHAYVRVIASLISIQTSRTFQGLELVHHNIDDYIEKADAFSSNNINNIAATKTFMSISEY
ncbi:hypothetical protein MKK63_09675 [Methylobacterium sp. J-088]|uniref:hypothetical protein n=1 Tax=Methylobacterium sp. J-088 TaxID=2836664 RepID=UPI001FBAC16C|nr:hypothetical protein [Methylobacterium sp. J-088]MCJ2062978.1 hypothetical protein [Methylobacterium sp. J-088]